MTYPNAVWDGLTSKRTHPQDVFDGGDADYKVVRDELMAVQRYSIGTVAMIQPATSTLDGTQVILPAVDYDRYVQVTCKVTEDFVDGDGSQPGYQIGKGGEELDAFTDGSDFTDATAGTVFHYLRELQAGEALTLTGTAATGTGGGFLDIFAMGARKAQ